MNEHDNALEIYSSRQHRLDVPEDQADLEKLGVDGFITTRLERIEEFTVHVHGVAAQQEERIRKRIEDSLRVLADKYDSEERIADANLQRVIADARQMIADAQLVHRQTNSQIAESRDRESAAIATIEEQTTYLFAACRKAAKRIYTGQTVHRNIHENLTENITITEQDLIETEALIQRIQEAISQNDLLLLSDQSSVEAFEAAIREAQDEQRRLHRQAQEKKRNGVDRMSDAYASVENSSDPDEINTRLGDLESIGAGWGGELIYTATDMSTVNSLSELTNIIMGHREVVDGLIEEMAKINLHNQQLTSKWQELCQKREGLYRYLGELAELKLQVVNDIAQLSHEILILSHIINADFSELGDIPYSLREVISAAYELLAYQSEATGEVDNSVGFIQVHIGDADQIAQRYSTNRDDMSPFVFGQGDSIDDARASISHTTAKFGLPPALKETFAKVAEQVQVSPRAFRPGMQLRVAIEPSHQG